MAAPTVNLVVKEPTSNMAPCPVGVYVDTATSSSGDGSALAHCVFIWYVTPTGSTSLDNWEDKYRKVTDPRFQSPGGYVDIAGTTINTVVDLAGSSDTSTREHYLVRGFGQTYVLPEGTWTVSCRCINPSGEEATVTTSTITVAANTRTKKTVKLSGGDYSPSTWQDAEDWLLSATGDKWLELDPDVEVTLSTLMNLAADNIYISTAGDGNTKAIINCSFSSRISNQGVRAISLKQGFTGIVLENLTIRSGSDAIDTHAAMQIRGDNNAIVGCDFEHSAIDGQEFDTTIRFYSSSQVVNSNAIINCTAQTVSGTGAYQITWENSNGTNNCCIYGGTWEASLNESIFRTTTSADNANLCNVLYAYLDGSAMPSKSCLRYTRANYCHAYGVYAKDGEIWVGAAASGNHADNIRIEACKQTGASSGGFSIDVRDAATNVMIANCVVDTSDGGTTGLSTAAGAPTLGNENDNNVVAHCTVTGVNGFITTGGASDATYVSNVKILNNLIDTADSNGNCIVAVSGTLAAGTAIDGNVRTGGVFQGRYDGVDYDLTSWNALTGVGTDYDVDVAYDVDYVPTSGGQTVTTAPGVVDDYWSTPRSSTSWVGAVGSEPLGSYLPFDRDNDGLPDGYSKDYADYRYSGRRKWKYDPIEGKPTGARNYRTRRRIYREQGRPYYRTDF